MRYTEHNRISRRANIHEQSYAYTVFQYSYVHVYMYGYYMHIHFTISFLLSCSCILMSFLFVDSCALACRDMQSRIWHDLLTMYIHIFRILRCQMHPSRSYRASEECHISSLSWLCRRLISARYARRKLGKRGLIMSWCCLAFHVCTFLPKEHRVVGVGSQMRHRTGPKA